METVAKIALFLLVVSHVISHVTSHCILLVMVNVGYMHQTMYFFVYHLVICHIAMENHHAIKFGKPLFLWAIYTMANC